MSFIILYGYFRSGTTFFYRLFKENTQDKIILYEPDHTNLVNMINAFNFIEPYQPDNFKPFEEYSKLPDDVREKIKQLWIQDPCPLTLNDRLKKYVKFLEKWCDVIKVNRWGFIINDIMDTLPHAKLIIIMRNIYEVVQSHYNVFLKTGDHNVFDNLHYFNKIKARVPKQILNHVDQTNIIDRVIVNYLMTYSYVLSKIPLFYDRVLIVRYEDAKNDQMLKILSDFTGIEITSNVYIGKQRKIDEKIKERVDYFLRLFLDL